MEDLGSTLLGTAVLLIASGSILTIRTTMSVFVWPVVTRGLSPLVSCRLLMRIPKPVPLSRRGRTALALGAYFSYIFFGISIDIIGWFIYLDCSYCKTYSKTTKSSFSIYNYIVCYIMRYVVSFTTVYFVMYKIYRS